MFKWRKILGLLILTSIFSCKKSITSNEESTYSLPERPNILWIVAEDLGPYIPSFGDSNLRELSNPFLINSSYFCFSRNPSGRWHNASRGLSSLLSITPALTSVPPTHQSPSDGLALSGVP